MHKWLQIALVVASTGILISVLLLVIYRFCCARKRKASVDTTVVDDQIGRIHQVSVRHLDRDGTRKLNYYPLSHQRSAKPPFSWSDYPSLVTDAVENGWSRFAFAASPSTRASILGGRLSTREREVEMSWEVSQGSADFVQRIRFNSGLKRINWEAKLPNQAKSVVRSALPLPGPAMPLGNSSFPQEAYFEITVCGVHQQDDQKVNKSEGEKAMLIREGFDSKSKSESILHVKSRKLQEMNSNGGKEQGIVLSIGLSGGGGGGSFPHKLPGSYPGSVGFNSDGSVFLDGIKLVFESEEQEWGRTERVIGCGYSPLEKKVFFTKDSQLIHEIHCKSDDFGNPLYPTLAANADVSVLVNLGQCVFKYAAANRQRTPNPCFFGPLANSPVLGYEDSRELFSMGRIDSQWLNRSTTRSNNNTVNSIRAMEFDTESEGDLFEIVLEKFGRSPNTL